MLGRKKREREKEEGKGKGKREGDQPSGRGERGRNGMNLRSSGSTLETSQLGEQREGEGRARTEGTGVIESDMVV